MEDFDKEAATAVSDDLSAEKEMALSPLVQDIESKFERAKRDRLETEQRWNRSWYNFRGRYGREIEFTEAEQSRVFVKITKTKVMAAYGQIIDVLMSANRLPITIEPTPDPLGIEDEAHVDMKDPVGESELGPEETEPLLGYTGDGNEPQPGETLLDRLGAGLSKLLESAKIKSGPAKDMQNHLDLEPAAFAARKMEKKIHDQLVETDAIGAVSLVALECAMLGSGIIRGPFVEDKEYPKWTEEGDYEPLIKKRPRLEHVSLWDFYPDPEARTLKDIDYVIQRRKLTRTKMRQLKRRPYFRSSAIEEAIERGIKTEKLWWETELEEHQSVEYINRYEVLEFWGNASREDLEEYDVDVPEYLEDQDEFQINAWLCNGSLLRVVVNPFRPVRIPYLIVPYEVDPYSVFGIGCAENMEDCQTIMNGFARMTIDNAAKAGNLLIEVDETNLVPGQDLRVYPGKVFRRSGGAPGQAIFGTKWPSTINENMQVFKEFRQLADEATGLPSYSHGQTGVTGTTRTASGMSMLMGASALNIKTVIKNFDNYLLRPLGEAMFAFNMQFDHDPEIKGDLAVKAAGTTSLMQREIKSQRIIQLIQVGSAPTVAPWINFEYLSRQLAETLDLDPEKAVNNPKLAALQAQLMSMMGQAAPGQDNNMTSDPNQTGGGNMGVGAPPMPGETQFSGNAPVADQPMGDTNVRAQG